MGVSGKGTGRCIEWERNVYAWIVEMQKEKQSEARDGPWRSWHCHCGRSTELKFRRYASHRNMMDFFSNNKALRL